MLVIDIETTHFSKDKGHIVEVGIVGLDLGNGGRTVVFDNIVWEPSCSMGELERSWYWGNSDVKLKDIRGAMSWRDAFMQILKLICQDPDGVTAYNSSFDFGWMESRGIVFPCKLADSMKLCRPIVEATDKNGRIKNPNVEEAWAYFFPDEPYKEKHRAADDAMHEAAIIYELFKLGYYEKI